MVSDNSKSSPNKDSQSLDNSKSSPNKDSHSLDTSSPPSVSQSFSDNSSPSHPHILNTTNLPPPQPSSLFPTATELPTTILETSPSHSLHPMVTRTQDGTRRPRVLPSLVTSSSSSSLPPEPRSFTEAVKHAPWRQAMLDEYQALLRNNTWSLVPLPPSTNLIGSKWVYKIKQKSDGSLERYKARLVARGFNQQLVLIMLKRTVQVLNPPQFK